MDRVFNFHRSCNESNRYTVYQWLFCTTRNLLQKQRVLKNFFICLQKQSILPFDRHYRLFQRYCSAGLSLHCDFFFRKRQSKPLSFQFDSIELGWKLNIFSSCVSVTTTMERQLFLPSGSIVGLQKICNIMFQPFIADPAALLSNLVHRTRLLSCDGNYWAIASARNVFLLDAQAERRLRLLPIRHLPQWPSRDRTCWSFTKSSIVSGRYLLRVQFLTIQLFSWIWGWQKAVDDTLGRRLRSVE